MSKHWYNKFGAYTEWYQPHCETVSFPVISDYNPMDCSLPDSSVHGIFQARILEWVAILFSILWPRDKTRISCIADRLFTIWAKAIKKEEKGKGARRG